MFAESNKFLQKIIIISVLLNLYSNNICIIMFFLIVYTIIISIIDFYSNKFYKRVWNKKTPREKFA